MLPSLLGQTNLKFKFKETSDVTLPGEQKLTVEQLSSFLYYLNSLYDCLALAAIPDYSYYKFSFYFWRRSDRPLRDEHKLYLDKINYNSPLGLQVIIPLTAGALGIPLLMIQAIEKVQNWKLNRKKLKLEEQKLELEIEQKKLELAQMQLDIEQKRLDIQQQPVQLDNILHERKADKIFNQIMKQLKKNKLVAVKIEVEIKTDEERPQTQ